MYGEDVAPWIDGVLELMRDADRRQVGVLGVCFGAQAMAAAFGAEVRHAGASELGWRLVETIDARCVPPGPWFMWHSDTFDLPASSIGVARTELGPQAFAMGPHLCVQFHPEATAQVVGAWMDHDDSDFRRAGLSSHAVLDETRRREPEARARAAALVDRFLERARVPSTR